MTKILAAILVWLCFSCDQRHSTGKEKQKTFLTGPNNTTIVETQTSKPVNNNIKCETIYKNSLYFYNTVSIDDINKNKMSNIFTNGFEIEKISRTNPHDSSVIDTVYRIKYKNSFIDLEKPYDARKTEDDYSNWSLIKIKDKSVVLSNGLKIGVKRSDLFRIINQPIPTCDTIRLNTDEMTYENYLVLKNDSVKEIMFSVTAD